MQPLMLAPTRFLWQLRFKAVAPLSAAPPGVALNTRPLWADPGPVRTCI
jgi:hypothetical protein